MVHFFNNIFTIYIFIYSIFLLKTHTATYTSKMLLVINFNQMMSFTFTANLPNKITVFTYVALKLG